MARTLIPFILSLAFLFSTCQSSDKKVDKETEKLEKEIVRDESALEVEEKDFEKEENEVEQMMKKEEALQSLSFLTPLKDKYPHEVQLLDNEHIKARLILLLGDKKYLYLKKIWQVDTPIEIKDSLFYAWGMEAHNGGDPSGVVMANLNQNILYVGIRQNGTEKMYAENNHPIPSRLMEWANEQ